MADRVNSSGGYVGSDGVFRIGTGYDLYIGTPNHSLVGILEFNKSVNGILNTAVTSWSQLNFTYAGAEVKYEGGEYIILQEEDILAIVE